MVQLRASLEAVVMQAWRDRWSELEWSINLKAALVEDTSELNKLCGLLLKQATLSEVPNTLMFSYLSYTVAAQVVSHASLLEAVITYKDFSRELCIEAILELLNDNRDRLKCNSADAFQCERLCNLLTQTVRWLLDAAEASIPRHNGELLKELTNTLISFMHNPFATLCLYFDHLEMPAEFNVLSEKMSSILVKLTQSSWVHENLTKDFRSFGQKLNSIPQLFFGPTRAIDSRELNPSGAHPTVLTLASVFGSVRILETPKNIGDALCAVYETFRLPWWLILRDFLRGSFLLQLDPGPIFPESGVTAYVYLKVPRVLEYLVSQCQVSSRDSVRAIENVAAFHPLLNSLDMKTRTNCFVHFIDELKKLSLLTDPESATLMEMRNRERITFMEHSSTGQPGIQLVLKGDMTLHTLMKSFKSDMVTKHDKLVQMLSHMITGGGKSFEYICAAASATNLLNQFSSRLVEFNRASQVVNGDDSDVRCKMFDVSFLLLSRISYWFGFDPVTVKEFTLDGKSSSFLDNWYREYGNPRELSETGVNAENSTSLMDSSTQSDSVLEQLKSGKKFWDKDTCDWGEMCCKVPSIGSSILAAVRRKELTEAQLQKIFDTLQSDVCGLVMCMSQWLSRQDTTEERKTVAHALQTFVDLTPPTSDHRRSFMASAVKKVLVPILEPKTIPSPTYPWLINCGRHQLPQLGHNDIPGQDHLRQGFIYALRQGWACSGVLNLVEKCRRVEDNQRWTRAWMEEMMKLVSVEEMSMACEMSLGVSVLSPISSLVSLSSLVMDFVMRTGHELYCVAPRGTVLARFVVHAYILAFQLETLDPDRTTSVAASTSMDGSDCRVMEDGWKDPSTNEKAEEPKAKIRRVEDTTDSKTTSDPETALRTLYGKFTDICEDGEVRPGVYFVASFLRVLSENTNNAAKKMISLLPLPLLHQVIRIDPKIISAPTVLSLHNLDERSPRQRALQNLCLLRQLRAL